MITTGTDTLEELAVVCALTHDAAAPIVLTGANRPASRPGADGPANLLDAVALAGSERRGRARDRGRLRRRDPCRDERPQGRQHRTGGVRLAGRRSAGADRRGTGVAARAAAGPPDAGAGLAVHRVPIVTAALGDDGELLRSAAQTADGLVVAALGAGHLPPGMLTRCARRRRGCPPAHLPRRARGDAVRDLRLRGRRARPARRAAPSAFPSCRRRRRGWRCCAAWARGSTAQEIQMRWRRGTLG